MGITEDALWKHAELKTVLFQPEDFEARTAGYPHGDLRYLVLVEIEFDGLQLPDCVRYTPNLVWRDLLHPDASSYKAGVVMLPADSQRGSGSSEPTAARRKTVALR